MKPVDLVSKGEEGKKVSELVLHPGWNKTSRNEAEVAEVSP